MKCSSDILHYITVLTFIAACLREGTGRGSASRLIPFKKPRLSVDSVIRFKIKSQEAVMKKSKHTLKESNQKESGDVVCQLQDVHQSASTSWESIPVKFLLTLEELMLARITLIKLTQS